MKKRVVSLVLLVCMIASMLPLRVAANAEVAGGSCGEDVTWSLSADGTLTISGTGPMTDYTQGQAPWKGQPQMIQEVVVEEGVSTIGANAFFLLTCLTRVSVPTTLTEIHNCAFMACFELKTISLPEGLTVIGESAFEDCYSLVDFHVPQTVTTIGRYAFCGAKLEKVRLPDGIVQIADYAFAASGLQEVSLHEGVVSIGAGAFFGTDIQYINIPDKVRSIGESAFGSCHKLIELHIPEGVESIGNHVAHNCQKLETVSIPSTVTTMGYGLVTLCPSLVAVELCDGNKSYIMEDQVIYTADRKQIHTVLPVKSGAYVIPETVTAIGPYAAMSCEKLTAITIPTNVTSMGIWAFNGCKALTEVTVPHSIQELPERAFGCCDNLKSVSLPYNLTTIGEEAFTFCRGLTKISIPAGVTFIGSGAFRDCDAMKFIVFHGDAPLFEREVFFSTVTTAYYPTGNSTWNTTNRQNYGGTITWRVNTLCQIGHSLSDWTTIQEPTCTAEGIKQRSCYTCGLLTLGNIPQIEHRYTESIIPATCTQTGCRTLVCEECADIQTQTLPPKGHEYMAGICINCGQNQPYYQSGDTSGDGVVNMKDWNVLYAYVNELIVLSDEALACADVNGDGKVNMKDWNRLYEHINEVNPLW